MSQRRYVLWGSAGHAKVLGEMIAAAGDTVVDLFDNSADVESALPGVPVFVGLAGFRHWRRENPGTYFGLAAIGGGRGRDRLQIQTLFSEHGVTIAPALVHRSSSVSSRASVGAGSQILAQSVVAADAVVGMGCILNHRSGVDHESRLGHGVHLAPGATICGLVTLGDNVMVGAGATIGPRVTVGENTVIGAGAVVTRDLPAGVVAYGVPARIVRNVESKEA